MDHAGRGGAAPSDPRSSGGNSSYLSIAFRSITASRARPRQRIDSSRVTRAARSAFSCSASALPAAVCCSLRSRSAAFCAAASRLWRRSTHCGCLCPARQPSCTPLGRPRAKVGIDVVRYIRPDRCPKVYVFASYRELLPMTTEASSAARTKSDRGQPRCDNVETCVCKITKAATLSDPRATPHSGTATRKATLRAEEPAGGAHGRSDEIK